MKKLILIFFILLTPSIGYTQIKPDAGQILNQENERERIKEIPKQIPKSLLEPTKKKDFKSSDEKTLIKSFKFQGDIKAFQVAELQNLLSDLVNTSLNLFIYAS